MRASSDTRVSQRDEWRAPCGSIKHIGIFSAGASEGRKRLLESLEAVFPIRFCFRADRDEEGLDAVLMLEASRIKAERLLQHTAKSCFIQLRQTGAHTAVGGRTASFTDGKETPAAFRGREVDLHQDLHMEPIESEGRGSVVAAVADCPVWRQKTDRDRRTTFVSLPLPELKESEYLIQHFGRRRFLSLLPLVDFIRYLTTDPAWIRPPRRACLMFDDPNLHWPTYGHLDYRKLVSHAIASNYHVAFATIPLDTWYSHPGVVRLFKSHPERLSLLFHGNDHTKRELAITRTDERRERLLLEALGRMERFEAKTGLHVSRVMAPPHGACSEHLLLGLRKCGYEAACISNSSLRSYNREKAWARNLGFGIVNLVDGFPVVPRFRLDDSCINDVLLADYLDQAIVPVAHHDAGSSNMCLLARTAEVINSLGSVIWASAGDISRLNYLLQVDGTCLRILSRARCLNVRVPEAVDSILVEECDRVNQEDDDLVLCRESGDRYLLSRSGPTPVSLATGEKVSIRFSSKPELRGGGGGFGRVPVRAFARRQLTEMRDRFAPLFRGGRGHA